MNKDYSIHFGVYILIRDYGIYFGVYILMRDYSILGSISGSPWFGKGVRVAGHRIWL